MRLNDVLAHGLVAQGDMCSSKTYANGLLAHLPMLLQQCITIASCIAAARLNEPEMLADLA